MSDKPSFFSRLFAGRGRKVPKQETVAYARLMNLGSIRGSKDRPLIKPTPSNLRKFSRSVHARRAINRIKNAIAALDWEVVAAPGVKESREILRQIEVTGRCLSRPNNDDSFRTLVEQVVEDYLVCGQGAIEQETGSDQIRPLWMWPVDGTSIQIFGGWSGDKNEARYLQTMGFGGNVGGQSGIQLRNDQLILIRKDPSTDVPYGFGALEIAFSTINRKLGVADYAGNVASNGQPENLLSFPGMGEEQLQTMRGWWRNEIEGEGMTPMIGGTGVEAIKLRGSTDDALFLKFQDMLVREIATAFELSPQNLGIEADVNRNTSEVADDRDWESAIIPAARNIESYLNREAIQGKLGFSQIRFRFLGLDRADELNMAKVYETEFKNNSITPNEYRAYRGRAPMESMWGDRTFADMQIAMKAATGSKETVTQIADDERGLNQED